MRGFEKVCLPVQATFMDLLTERNFSQPRDKPLFVVIDELHLPYLPRLERWLAVLRSSGLVMILLTQATSQLVKAYGENDYKTIYNTTGTKVIMNPDDIDTATATSNRLGNKEVRYQQKSRSYARSGSSRSHSEQVQQIPLKTADEINKMDIGEFILLNWGYKNQGKTGIPLLTKYKVPQHEFDLENRCQEIWEQKYLPSLISRARKKPKTPKESEDYLIAKTQEVLQLLPPRPELTQNQDQNGKDRISNSDIHNLKPEETRILSNHDNAIPLP